MKKRVAVIAIGVRLEDETMGVTRSRSVAESLVAAGFDVDLITSSFQHWEKAQRSFFSYAKNGKGDSDTYRKRARGGYDVVYIYEPGYKRNIDLGRVRSHAQATSNLASWMERFFSYSIVYCVIPPNNFALAGARAAHAHGVPFVVDVNDLWPEAMRMAFDLPPLSTLLYRSFARDAASVYKLASAVVGTSQEYADRAFEDRPRDIPEKVVYVGNELSDFDAGASEHAASVSKPEGEFWVTYAGTLGLSYDISTLVMAAAMLKEEGYSDIRIKVLGDGPTADSLKQQAAALSAPVDFLGYRPYGEMAAWLCASDILVNSFVLKAPQSIVNKIADYLAAGKPMINTSMSPEFTAKVEGGGFGVNVAAENAPQLAGCIEALHDNPAARKRMGLAARGIAEKEFDRAQSYKTIVNLCSDLMAKDEAERIAGTKKAPAGKKQPASDGGSR